MEGFKDIIEEAWRSSQLESIMAKFDRCQSFIIQWTKEKNFNSGKELKSLQDKLEKELSATTPSQNTIDLITIKLKRAY